MNKSPLRYIGGKTRAIKKLWELFPKNITEVASLFCGGCSFELFLAEKGIKVYASDNFKSLIRFWVKLKLTQPYGLYNDIIPFLKEKEAGELEGNFKEFGLTDECIPECFYVKNRVCYGGDVFNGGVQKGTPRFTEKSCEDLFKVDLNNIVFDHLPFEEAFNKNRFQFLDPPYYGKEHLYNAKEFDHRRLNRLLKKPNKGFMLCYNDVPEIREMYKDFRILELNWSYGLNKSKKSNEIVIMNY